MTRGALSTEDDLLSLIEHAADEARGGVEQPDTTWKVLVVDDDEEVHRATGFAIGSRRILGRPIALLHARSSAEAVAILRGERDVAVALVDVVMEREQAGLELVGIVRDKLRLTDLRIILRTGQPGFAPELEAVTRYDINDYHAKLEMSQGRLIAALTTALRTYEQLSLVSANRHSLEALTRLAPRAVACESVRELFGTVVASTHEIIPCVESVAIIRRSADSSDVSLQAWNVVRGSGRFAEVEGRSIAEHVDDDAAESFAYVVVTGKPHGSMMRRIVPIAPAIAGGPFLWVETVRPLRPHEIGILDVSCITAHAALSGVDSRERLSRLALVDAATGLPSRVAFEQALKADEEFDSPTRGVVLLDLDRLDDVRDTMGSPMGDELLAAAASRLCRVVNGCSLSGRIATATVGCIVPRLSATPEEILAAFEEPLRVGGFDVRLPVILGMANARTARASGVDLLSAASLALSSARRTDHHRARVFERSILDDTRSRLARLEALRHAVGRNELELHYQPQVDIASGRVTGVEALVRWRRSSGELVPPLTFIDLAEQSGLIIPIGEWVLREACRQLGAWDSSGMPPLRMAVNVSVAQFNDANFASSVERAITDFGLDPKRLELELTESVGLEDLVRARDVMNQVGRLGVSWALDDFGVGYSSLGYLRSLPIARLKIDRLFTGAIQSPTDGVIIPKMIIDLARDLGLEVIAEGVESAEVAETLLAFGCREGQGYLYSKPITGADLRAFVQRVAPSRASPV